MRQERNYGVETSADGARVVTIGGELDFHSTPRLRQQLEEQKPLAGDGIVLDLSGLTFLDSSGLSLVIEVYNRAKLADAPFAVVACGRPIVHLFEVTGLVSMLGVVASRDEALAAVHATV